MKKLTMIALAAASAGALFAQSAHNITGTWQGTLQAEQELRLVMKISKGDDGGLKSVMYSIDQGAQGIPGPVTAQGSAVKITLPGIGGTFEGKLDSDGAVMAGTWTQGPKPLPLNLKRVAADAAWPIPERPAPPKPMAKDANPVFEVATIKPSNPDAPGKAFRVRGREFSTLNTTVNDILTFAYGVHVRQIVGGPAWMETEKYDITAKPDGEGQPNDKQWKAMVQKLLADRFKFTFHNEKKELSAYAIVVGKNGPKLTKSEGDPNGLPGLFFRGLGDLPVRNATMTDFARTMQGAVMDRPVIDQTELSGRFDFELKWTPDETQFTSFGPRPKPAADDPAAPPDLYTAIQQQLGLQLKSVKAPVDVIAVDRVEKPTSN